MKIHLENLLDPKLREDPETFLKERAISIEQRGAYIELMKALETLQATLTDKEFKKFWKKLKKALKHIK